MTSADTTDDHDRLLSTPRTVIFPAYFNLADRLAAVGDDNRATVKVADMSIRHRQNVIMMLDKLRNSLFMYHFARVDHMLPFDDEPRLSDEWRTLGSCLTSPEKLHAWFEDFALIRALRAANIADKEARLGGPVLPGD